jgi:hypothetical protein
VRRIAGVIASFHRSSATDEHVALFGRPDALRLNWDENFTQTAPFIGRTLSPEQNRGVRHYVEAFLRERKELVEERAASGRVRDCHGDLRSEAIVIGEDGAICVMDCIEFNDRIRYGDVAGDIAFLAMDLDYRGRADLADELMTGYLNDVDDETLPCVLDFYRCYRAFVRGKVESMQLDETEVSESQRAAAAGRARAYFALALEYAQTPSPRALVVMVGLSGSGKSHMAGAVASRLGAVLLRSDMARRRLAGMVVGEHADLPYGSGVYSDEGRAQVYEVLHASALEHLRRGRPVVLDATYARLADRNAARRVAEAAGVPAMVLQVMCDEGTVRRRLARRREESATVSDARWETYLAQREHFQPPHDDEVAPERLLRLDGAASLRENVERALRAVRGLTASR